MVHVHLVHVRYMVHTLVQVYITGVPVYMNVYTGTTFLQYIFLYNFLNVKCAHIFFKIVEGTMY